MNDSVIGIGMDGRPVTEADLDAITANAEAGFPGVTARPLGRPTIGDGPARMVGVRLDPDLDMAMRQRLRTTGGSASELMRDALREYLRAA
jgi:hypothetical protein